MIVHARQQHCAGWRAGRRSIKIRQPHAFCDNTIDVGRSDFAAKRAEIGEAQIIRHDQKNVGFVVRPCVGG